MLCNDPLANTLERIGFNLVRLPRPNLDPLLVLARSDSDLEVFGDLAVLLEPGAALPPINRDVPVAQFTGDRAKSGAVDLNVGLGFLGTVLSAMGAGSVGLDAAFQQAATVTFEFYEPRQDEIRPADLDSVLSSTPASEGSAQLNRLRKRNAIFVTTATLKCRKFRVDAKSSSGHEVGLDASQIQAVVGAKVNVKTDTSNSSSIIYEGEQALVFGFQAVRLRYGLFGRFNGFERVSPGEAMLRSPDFVIEPVPSDPVLSKLQVPGSTFLDLRDEPADD